MNSQQMADSLFNVIKGIVESSEQNHDDQITALQQALENVQASEAKDIQRLRGQLEQMRLDFEEQMQPLADLLMKSERLSNNSRAALEKAASTEEAIQGFADSIQETRNELAAVREALAEVQQKTEATANESHRIVRDTAAALEKASMVEQVLSRQERFMEAVAKDLQDTTATVETLRADHAALQEQLQTGLAEVHSLRGTLTRSRRR